MRIRTPVLAASTMIVAVSVLAGCGQEDAPLDVTADGDVPSVASPDRDDPVPPVEPTGSAVITGVPDERVLEASTMLAEQIGFNAVDISVVRGFPVEWRDGALGCEEKDMGYIQALQPGYYVELEADGEMYGFHGKDGQAPFYCATPSEPITPST